MSLDTVLMALGVADIFPALLLAFWFIGGGAIYFALVRQTKARPPPNPADEPRRFGLPEAVVAAVLIFFLLFGLFWTISHPAPKLRDDVLVQNLFFILAIVLVIAAFLRLRGFKLSTAAGFSKISFLRALSVGIILLLAAYPLIAIADWITQRFLGSGSSRQSIVELFSGSSTIQQRVTIIFFAVAVAPTTEEFLFRFFLYGVLRRYLGRFLGLVSNALLFAAVHTHLPSFAPLFVLGSCFTLAYEWSGSILVSMTMHALFNSVSLIALAFPDFFSQ
jgi:membrane protease YdiL (CAAX protease family)